MSDYELSAVIPTVQYGNVQPTLRGKDLAKLQEEMDSLWQQYTGKGLKTHETGSNEVSGASTLVVCSASGVKVTKSADYHHYINDKRLYGAGTFAGMFKKEFPREMIIGKMMAKLKKNFPDTEWTAEHIADMWDTKGTVSKNLGTSLHAAIELRGRYEQLALDTGKTPDVAGRTGSPLIDPIVDSVFELFEHEATYEPFVADAESKLCGYIDRLAHVDPKKKIVRVQDYKSNLDLSDKETITGYFKGMVDDTKLGAYWIQLSVYAHILEKHGYTVEGLDIFDFDHETRTWTIVSHDVLDIAPALKTVELA